MGLTAPLAMKFSANLGFLFREFPLPDAVREAAKAGFTAIECHWPYDTDPSVFRAALNEAGLPLLSLNTAVGDAGKGDFGVSAIPGREAEARRFIDRAVEYAVATGAGRIHVMAGRAEGPAAHATFVENLRYADQRIGDRDISLLIEPLNSRDAPGYFLKSVEEAAALIDVAGIARLRMMFDCYHTQIQGGDLLRRFQTYAARIGHIQIASVPERCEPDTGEVAYERLLPAMVESGYAGWFGAEYRPRAGTVAGLTWLSRFTGRED
jgi:hydroxypyruvate isomerase